MALGTIAPSPKFTGLDDDANPVSNGKLYTYVAGTTTPLTVYQDVDLTVPHANPIRLDAGGRTAIYLPQVTVKFSLFTEDDALIWTQDNVPATSLGEATGIGEIFIFAGDPTSPVTNTVYPAGDTVDKTHAGSALLYVDSVNLLGTYVIEAMLMAAGGAEVSVAIVDLDDGDPDTPLASAASVSTTGELVQSGTVAFAAPGMSRRYGIKVKITGSGSGYVWGVRLVQVGGGSASVPTDSPLALSTIPLGGDPVNGIGFQANGTYYWTGGVAALINWDAIPAAYGLRAHIWSRVSIGGGSIVSDIYNQTDSGVAVAGAAVVATSFQADGSEQILSVPRLTGTKYYRGRTTLTSCTDKDALIYGFLEVYLL